MTVDSSSNACGSAALAVYLTWVADTTEVASDRVEIVACLVSRRATMTLTSLVSQDTEVEAQAAAEKMTSKSSSSLISGLNFNLASEGLSFTAIDISSTAIVKSVEETVIDAESSEESIPLNLALAIGGGVMGIVLLGLIALCVWRYCTSGGDTGEKGIQSPVPHPSDITAEVEISKGIAEPKFGIANNKLNPEPEHGWQWLEAMAAAKQRAVEELDTDNDEMLDTSDDDTVTVAPNQFDVPGGLDYLTRTSSMDDIDEDESWIGTDTDTQMSFDLDKDEVDEWSYQDDSSSMTDDMGDLAWEVESPETIMPFIDRPENMITPRIDHLGPEPENIITPRINLEPENMITPRINFAPENMPENMITPRINFASNQPEGIATPVITPRMGTDGRAFQIRTLSQEQQEALEHAAWLQQEKGSQQRAAQLQQKKKSAQEHQQQKEVEAWMQREAKEQQEVRAAQLRAQQELEVEEWMKRESQEQEQELEVEEWMERESQEQEQELEVEEWMERESKEQEQELEVEEWMEQESKEQDQQREVEEWMRQESQEKQQEAAQLREQQEREVDEWMQRESQEQQKQAAALRARHAQNFIDAEDSDFDPGTESHMSEDMNGVQLDFSSEFVEYANYTQQVAMSALQVLDTDAPTYCDYDSSAQL